MNRSEGYFIEFRMKPIDTRALSAYKKGFACIGFINKQAPLATQWLTGNSTIFAIETCLIKQNCTKNKIGLVVNKRERERLKRKLAVFFLIFCVSFFSFRLVSIDHLVLCLHVLFACYGLQPSRNFSSHPFFGLCYLVSRW